MGATLGLKTHTLGPDLETQTAIFSTTIASVCVSTKTSSSTNAVLAIRADLTPTTVETLVTYTGTGCISQTINCPASWQTPYLTSYTSTYATVAASGVSVAFPNTTDSSVASTVDFGPSVYDLGKSSGTPKTYDPTSSGGGAFTTSVGTIAEDFLNRNNNKLKIGLSIGLGVPALIALVVLFIW
jgi:hypothetical protein